MEGRTDYSPRKRISILITARAHLALRRLARKKGVSMNEMIQEWIGCNPKSRVIIVPGIIQRDAKFAWQSLASPQFDK